MTSHSVSSHAATGTATAAPNAAAAGPNAVTAARNAATAAANAAAAALRDAAAITGRVEVVVGAVRNWMPYPDLVRPERVGDLVDSAAAVCGGCPTPAARTAAATLMAGDVASAFATPIASALVAHRRALLLDPDDVSIRVGADGVDGLAVNGPVVGLLPDDPLAGQEHTTVIADLGALRTAAAEGYAKLLTPILDLMRGAVRRGRRALWADATDRLAGAVFLAQRSLGRPDRAPAEVAQLLAAGPLELRGPVEWVDVAHRDRHLPWKRRSVCCLAYQTPRWATRYCATCPLVSREETVRRIGEWLRDHD